MLSRLFKRRRQLWQDVGNAKSFSTEIGSCSKVAERKYTLVYTPAGCSAEQEESYDTDRSKQQFGRLWFARSAEQDTMNKPLPHGHAPDGRDVCCSVQGCAECSFKDEKGHQSCTCSAAKFRLRTSHTPAIGRGEGTGSTIKVKSEKEGDQHFSTESQTIEDLQSKPGPA